MQGNSYYTAEEVQLASGIVEGDNLFFINRFSVVSRIFTRLPYVEDVSISRYLPNKVVLTISESQALAYVSYEGEPWVIDRSCRMLTQAGADVTSTLIEVRGITPMTAEVGSVFETGPDDTGQARIPLCDTRPDTGAGHGRRHRLHRHDKCQLSFFQLP